MNLIVGAFWNIIPDAFFLYEIIVMGYGDILEKAFIFMLNKNTHRPILYHTIPDVLLFLKISFFFIFSHAVNMN